MRLQRIEGLNCVRLQRREAVTSAGQSALSQAPSLGLGRLPARHRPPVSVLQQCAGVLPHSSSSQVAGGGPTEEQVFRRGQGRHLLLLGLGRALGSGGFTLGLLLWVPFSVLNENV